MPYAIRSGAPSRARAVWRRLVAGAAVSGLLVGGLVAIQVESAAAAPGTITGNVFRDYNSNGQKDTAGGIGVAVDSGLTGVVVTGYDRDGNNVGTTTVSAANGDYTLTVTPAESNDVRVEFTSLPAGFEPSFVSTSASASPLKNRGQTQFVQVGATGVNFAANAPEDYSQSNPPIITAIQRAGSANTPSLANEAAIVAVPWTAGYSTSTGQGTTFPNRTTIATIPQVGSIWGTAFQGTTNSLYAAATYKRHSGLGPGGIAQIYRITGVLNSSGAIAASPTVTQWLNLQGKPIIGGGTVDLGTAATDAARGIGLPTAPARDLDGYQKAGEIGIGAIAVSADQNTLYFVNLFDRNLYSIDISDPVAAASSPQITRYNLGLAAGQRPWALELNRGYIYIGYVDSGEANATPVSATSASMRAHIIRAAETAPTSWSSDLLNLNLGYVRGTPAGGSANPAVSTYMSRWNSWTDSWNFTGGSVATTWFGGQNIHVFPQPILSSIQFDGQGYVTLGLLDRASIQGGNRNHSTIVGDTTTYESLSNGDLLMASQAANGTMTVESNAAVGTRTGTGSAAQAPGGQEFYRDEQNLGTGPFHQEIGLGGLTGMGGVAEVAATVYDPLAEIRVAGTNWFSTTNGAVLRGYNITPDSGGSASTDGSFQKGGGLGDIEALSDDAPLQIGNRVWFDADQDGIQDADEAAIANVTVNLVQGATVLATRTTDASGTYYFSSTDADLAGEFIADGGSYTVQFIKPTTGTFASGIGTASWADASFTTTNAGANDEIDSDAVPNVSDATKGEIVFSAPSVGENDFSFDAGFTANGTLHVVKAISASGGASPPGATYPLTLSAVDFRGDSYNVGANAAFSIGVGAGNAVDISLPFGTVATVSESASTGVVSFSVSPGTPVTIAGTGASQSVVTVTNTLKSTVDLALRKQLTGFTGSVVGGTAQATFTITVVNQGTTAVNPVVVRDYIQTSDFTALSAAQPVTATYTSPSATGSVSWVISGAGTPSRPALSIPALAAGQSVSFPITLAIEPTALNAPIDALLYNFAEISYVDTDGNTANGDSANGNVVDIDSIPDADAANDGTVTDDDLTGQRWTNDVISSTLNTTGNLDEDDHDVASVPLYDLALIKDLTTSESGYVDGPLPDAVTFDVTIENQGATDAYNIAVQDRPGAEMTITPADNASQTPTSSASNVRTVTYGGADVWTIDHLAPGESVTFQVTTRVTTDVPTPPYYNVAEIVAFDNTASTVDVIPAYVQDVDSTPDNDILAEDDQDDAYVTLLPLVVGSTLFLDTDSNGSADVRAPAGIIVDLLDATDDSVVDSVETDANGNYYFDAVAPGSYRVAIPADQSAASNPTALDGYASVPGASANPSTGNTLVGDSGDDGAIDLPNGWSAISASFSMAYGGPYSGSAAIDLSGADTFLGYSVSDASSNLNIDFIFSPAPEYRVGNRVWYDVNNNGLLDGTEAGIDGVTVNLRTSGGALVATTTTATGGYYLFENLPAGDYYVEIPSTDFGSGAVLEGLRASSGAGVEALTETGGDDNSNTIQLTPTAAATTSVFTLGSATDPFDASEPTGEESGGDAWTDGDDRSNLTIDLGFYQPLRLGSLVWLDDGNNGAGFTLSNEDNGIADADEVAIADGLELELWRDVDTDGLFEPTGADSTGFVASVTTVDGTYVFDDVAAGDYFVAIAAGQSQLSGLRSSTPDTNAGFPELADDDDDGQGGVTGYIASSGVIELAYGGEPTTESGDFGNSDSETRADTFTGSTTDDLNSQLYVDFGFSPDPQFRIGNLVWSDWNNNGVQDSGEPAIPGVEVELYTDDGTTPGSFDAGDTQVGSAVTTDANGHYEFTGLDAGGYFVVLPGGQPALDGSISATPVSVAGSDSDTDNNANGSSLTGFSSGLLSVGDGVDDHSEPTGETDATTSTLVETGGFRDDRSNLTVDFGVFFGLRLGNQVWLDQSDNDATTIAVTDNNGYFDSGEIGIAGVTVALWLDDGDTAGTFEPGATASDDSFVASTSTDLEGNYVFENLAAGTYFVVIQSIAGNDVQPSGTVPSATPETADNDNDGARGAGASSAYLSVSAPVTLSLGGEPSAESDTVPGDTGTGSDGSAESEANGSTGWAYADTSSNLHIDFGFIDVPLYRIGNLVWRDLNNDGLAQGGVDEPSEPGIEGVLVQLLDGTGAVIDSTVTDASGKYAFENLVAGDYEVRIPSVQSGVGVIPTALAGLASSTTDAGAPGVDADDNDDNGVVGTGGWRSGVFAIGDLTGATTQTEPTDELLRDDLTTDGDDGGAGTDAQSNFTVDFGFYPLGRIGSTVWLDNGNGTLAFANDGILNNGEAGIDGVLVQLYNTLGPVAETVTTGGGHYAFTNLVSGNYSVRIPTTQTQVTGDVLPSPIVAGALTGLLSSSGQTTTAGLDGVDDGEPSAGYASEASVTLTIASAPTAEAEYAEGSALAPTSVPDASSDLTIDFGFIEVPSYRIGNLLWWDYNNNGTAESGEPGIAGVLVQLFDDASTPALVAETVTDADGRYAFDGLAPGNYSVRVPGNQTPVDSGLTALIVSGALDGMVSSTGTSNPESDTDDNDDNGALSAADWVTGLLTVGDTADPYDASEPTGETDAHDVADSDAEAAANAVSARADAQSNLTVDLGFYRLRLGSTVWLDDGNGNPAFEDDGVVNNGEAGIPGVRVDIIRDDGDGVLNSADTVIGYATTDADGHYYVGDATFYTTPSSAGALTEGSYFVGVVSSTALDALRSSTGYGAANFSTDERDQGEPGSGYASVSRLVVLDAGSMSNGDSAAEGDADTALGFSVPDDSSNLAVDFGFSPVPEYQLGNLIWRDYDDDGLVDSGEPGISGVVVELYTDDGTTAGQLDAADSLVTSVTTGGDGRYDFTALPAGDYLVHVPTQSVLSGWREAGPTVPDADGGVDNDNNAEPDSSNGGWTSGAVTLGGAAGVADHSEPTGEADGNTGASAENGAIRDDRSNQTVDFGFFAGLRIGNQVWLDDGAGADQADGEFDSGESGISALGLELWLDNGATDNSFEPGTAAGHDEYIGSTATDAEGNYVFGHLEPGRYFVAVPTLAGGLSSPGTVGSGIADDNEDDGDAIGGYVSVSGPITIAIGGATAVTAEQDTVAGDTGTGPDDAAETEANAANGFYRDVDSYLTVDFGFVDVPLYRIGNLVWADWNNNGTVDGVGVDREPGIEGVLVQLLDASSATIAETVTDANGVYEFANLSAGDYQVYIPAAQSSTGPASALIDPAALTGFVGSTVSVADADGNVDNDSNGEVQTSGSVTTGWLSGAVTLGGAFADEPVNEQYSADDATDDDAGQTTPRIDDNRSNFSVDFGFYSISVGNHLWYDYDNDGVWDAATDAAVVNAVVELRLQATDAVVATTTTGVGGLYLFTGLVDGTQYRVTVPAVNFASGGVLEGWYGSPGATTTYVNDGRDHGTNGAGYSDIDGEPFTADAGFMPTGENTIEDFVNDSVRPDANTNLFEDFSFYQMELGGVVFDDGDNNGHDDADGYFENVTLLLYLSNGSPFLRADGTQATTTTNAAGEYLFTDLPEGDYIVEIPASEFTEELTALGSSDGNNDLSGFAPDADLDDLLEDNGNPVSGNLFNGDAVRSSVVHLGVHGEPSVDRTPTVGTPDDQSNLTVDFGFWAVQINLELGNQLWFDTNKNGRYDSATEAPVPAGVLIQLFDADTDTLLDWMTTDSNGQYLFSGLSAGRYYLYLPASNFATGGPLHGYTSTRGPGVSTDPNDGIESDSNGADEASGGVRSAVVDFAALMPTGEVDSPVTVTDDRLSNLTLDFGLVLSVLAFSGMEIQATVAAVLLMMLLGGVLIIVGRRSRRRVPAHRA